MTNPSPIASLIAAGEALRKAAQGKTTEAYLHGCDFGRTGNAESRGAAGEISADLIAAIEGWNKAKRAAGAGGKRLDNLAGARK